MHFTKKNTKQKRLDFVDKLIEEHRISKQDNTRKIFIMVTLIISLTLIFKKNNYCRL